MMRLSQDNKLVTGQVFIKNINGKNIYYHHAVEGHFFGAPVIIANQYLLSRHACQDQRQT